MTGHDHDSQVAAFGECVICAATVRAVAPEPPTPPDPEAAASWRVAARRALEQVARTQAYLTADDVWDHVPAAPEPRAMGAVFERAALAGIIERTDRTDPSRRPAAHGRPVRVWRSNVYEPPRLFD